jgi:hypothetical protein
VIRAKKGTWDVPISLVSPTDERLINEALEHIRLDKNESDYGRSLARIMLYRNNDLLQLSLRETMQLIKNPAYRTDSLVSLAKQLADVVGDPDARQALADLE